MEREGDGREKGRGAERQLECEGGTQRERETATKNEPKTNPKLNATL